MEGQMSAAEIVPQETSDDDLVIFEQPATRVFENVHGQIVIRQTAEVFEDDPFVIFNRENLPTLISALSAYVSDVKAGAPTEAGERSHRNAAATRQKRYRERHRSNITQENRDVTTVTPDSDGAREDLVTPLEAEKGPLT
jgi:hypothetical protein